MKALPEAAETIAYTRYVLERGLSGDLLDLHVALARVLLDILKSVVILRIRL